MAQRKFKHKQTGKIAVEIESAYKKEEFRQYEVGKLEALLPPFLVENTNDWEEILKYPVGTKVRDNYCLGAMYEKTIYGWRHSPTQSGLVPEVDESQIGKGKRFEIVEEECSRGCPIDGTCTYPHCLKKKEPKWRITAFRSKRTQDLLVPENNYSYWVSEYMNNLHLYEIYSVEVLQEGKWVEYKLNDWFYVTEGVYKDHKFQIEEFKIPDNCNGSLIQFIPKGTWKLVFDNLCMKKLGKSSLFQLLDENGKMIDIYDGDQFYYTNKDSTHYAICRATNKAPNWIRLTNDWLDLTDGQKFATEKAAQQYIDLNQKRYSRQDILNALKEMKKEIFLSTIWEEHLKRNLNIKNCLT